MNGKNSKLTTTQLPARMQVFVQVQGCVYVCVCVASAYVTVGSSMCSQLCGCGCTFYFLPNKNFTLPATIFVHVQS